MLCSKTERKISRSIDFNCSKGHEDIIDESVDFDQKGDHSKCPRDWF